MLFLASALAFLAPWNWFADLLVNFRVQYVFSGACLAVILTALREWRGAAIAVAAGLLSLPAAWPFVATVESNTATPKERLRVASANVLFMNDEYAAVLAWARSRPADIIVFIEVTKPWMAGLRELINDYPYTAHVADAGIAVWSRLPLEPTREVGAETGKIFGLRTGVLAGGQRIDILAVHCTWPIRPALASHRAQQLAAIARYAKNTGKPLLVLGDFNASPLSTTFAEMLKLGGLHSAATGHGWRPTWPQFLPPMGIPIDHVLANKQLGFASFATHALPGSDHRAVVAGIHF